MPIQFFIGKIIVIVKSKNIRLIEKVLYKRVLGEYLDLGVHLSVKALASACVAKL